jgi:hypothetical protein
MAFVFPQPSRELDLPTIEPSSISEKCRQQQALDSSPEISSDAPITLPAATASIIEESNRLPPIQRFNHLLYHTSCILRTNGLYTINPSGHLICHSKPQFSLSDKRFAASLAAAQDAVNTKLHLPQPEGPVFEDLKIFHGLWDITTYILEEILGGEMDQLDQGKRDWGTLGIEAFGWGAWGLSAGYLEPDQLFLSHRVRLHNALTALLTLKNKGLEEGSWAVKVTPAGTVHTQATASRSVHICATMLLQSMRKDWSRVRWGHAVKICKRWMGNLGLLSEDEPMQDGSASLK